MHILIWMFLLGSFLTTTPFPAAAADTIRVGHFPNVTHVQGLVAQHLSRTGRGWFEQRLGPDVKIEWYIYNAGPSAMEAILADSIDLTYVGPSPALNAYTKSNGEEIRIVAAAAAGGAALIVQGDSNLKAPADFRGKTIPTPNPDQLALFKSRKLDAVWTVEPWVSRLERDAGGKVLVEQSKDSITVLVSGVKFLKTKRDLAAKFVRAHRELTEWILAHPEEAKQMVRQELAAETKAEVSADLIAQAWKRIVLTNDPSLDEYQHFVADAQRAGFIRSAPDLSRLIEKVN